MLIRKLKKLKSRTRILPSSKAERLKSGFVILKPGEEVGSHKTLKKEELLIILEGKATVVCENKEAHLEELQIIFIPENTEHNVRNDSEKILKYLYIVTCL